MIANISENEDEFIATHSRYITGFITHIGEFRRNALQNIIPGKMSKPVINLLEPVQIANQQGQL